MTHVLSASQFFNQAENPKVTAVREALLSFRIPDTIADLREFVLTPLSESENERSANYQAFLLDNYESIDEINRNDNALIVAGKDPISLYENGTYKTVLAEVYAMNENVVSAITGFLRTMTEDFSGIGIFQFILDILGLGLIPVPGLALISNALNAAISFFRHNYLMFFLNLIACLPGSWLTAPLKLMFKPFTMVFNKVIPKMFVKGGGKVAAAELKAANVTPKVMTTFAGFLEKTSRWIAETGLKVVRSIAPTLLAAVDKITFGAFKLERYIPKIEKTMDTWLVNLDTFGKEANIASKELLSGKTAVEADKTMKAAAKGVGDAAADTAKVAQGATKETQNIVRGFVTQTTMKRLGSVDKLTTAALKEVRASEKFAKLTKLGATDAMKQDFIYMETTRILADKVIGKEASILALTKNKAVMSTLSTGKVWKGADKLLGDAIKTGDKEAVRGVLTKMLDDPEFVKVMTKNSPDLTRAAALFKEVPEALTVGTKRFETVMKAGTKIAKPYRKRVFQNLVIFAMKQFLKGECGRWISEPDTAAETIDRLEKTISYRVTSPLKSVAKQSVPSAVGAVAEILDTVNEQEQLDQTVGNPDPQYGLTTSASTQILPSDVMSSYQKENPQAYTVLDEQQKQTQEALNSMKEATDSKSPCYAVNSLAQIGAGNILYNPAIYDETVAVDLKTQAQYDAINSVTKNQLKLINQDSNIDPMHPLRDTNPEIQAYFCDVYDAKNQTIDFNQQDFSRLDSTLDEMIRNGTMPKEDREAVKQKILNYWKTNTGPAEINKPTAETFVPNQVQMNESFRVRKLVTKR